MSANKFRLFLLFFLAIQNIPVGITIKDGSARDRFVISVGWINTVLSFNHRQWQVEEEKIPKSIIEAGEKILEKRSLHLTLPSSLQG